MGVVADVVYFALLVFLLLLIFRLVMEYVFLLARSYRPTGLVAAARQAVGQGHRRQQPSGTGCGRCIP